MARVFEPWAYGDAPRAQCFWNEAASLPEQPALDGDVVADVAIIGAGVTGLSAALHLARAGEKVAVLDANGVGWGASGRAGGFCCLGGGKISNAALTKRFGLQGRKEYRAAERSAVEYAQGLVEDNGWEVNRHSKGETLLAHTPRHWRAMQDEVTEIEADYGVTPELLPAEELRQNGMGGPFHGALTIPIGFAMHPRRYVEQMASAALNAGAKVFETSEVSALERVSQGFELRTVQGVLKAKRLIIATNGYSSEDIPKWMRARTMPLQSNILVTRPLNRDEQLAAGWTTPQMAHDTRNLLHYFRLMPDGRFLFGMRGGVYATPRVTARLRAMILRRFHRMFPAWAHVEVSHLWSGLVCLSRNATPYVGPIPGMPGAFAGLAYHGNGLAMGTYAGMLLSDLVCGRAPHLPYPDAFAAPMRRFPFGLSRRGLLVGANAVLGLADL
ncbi:MAG: FAD-binding oxidoreductase [Marinovum sp.]|nr:FAD-binding oxidoreductase [Marinovum sp.]